tara:strand:- start:1049 stop:1423 length:375 start_codon:yes stop_codon:yes gene_type:complete
MKLHHIAYKKNYKKYILECLKNEDIFIDKQPTDEELIDYLFDRFNSEYGWSIERQGKQKALTDWLQGLAIHIPFYYEDIIDLAIKMGSIDENPNEKLKERVCENYWSFMANAILSFEPKNKEVA